MPPIARPSALLAMALFALIGGQAVRAADQAVTLPYTQPDKDGNNWMVHYYGYLQQQGNMPVYSSTGVLTINGSSTSGRMQRTAKLDGKTGELVIENLPVGQTTVTRRFWFNKEDGYVRMIDVIRNTAGRDQQLQIVLNANANYGVQNGATVPDPKKKGQNYAFVAQTSANNRAMVEVFNGPGAKTPMNIEYQAGNSNVQGTISVNVPANKEIALMHVHAVTNSAADGQEFLKKLKDNKVLKDVPQATRKALINWNAGGMSFGDYEVLRGDANFDVVETRGGDQFRGTLKDPTYKITTFYGPVELPAAKVVGVVSVGAVRPRQLLFTTDGDVFGGTLEKDKLSLELSDGQSMDIPLAQVARAGYRRRADETDDGAAANADKPFVLMRTGERIAIKPPADALTVHTRFGPMKLRPEQLTAVVFQNEEHAVHEVRMADGTRLAAIVEAATLEVKLAASDQVIRFPQSSAARIQFRPDVTDVDESAPQLKLSNDETLVGTLVGKVQLDTGFSMLALDAAGLKGLARVKDSPADVQVTLWDDTNFRGQLQEPVVTCVTKGGLEVKIPIALVEEYTQPLPKPSAAIVAKVTALVAELNADDWQARQKAQEKLVQMGSMVAGVLRELKAGQPEEAQSRIDQVLTAVEKKGK
ncbi:MAG: hypothetical protein ACAI43_06825 [Phycisphaerae bacterium]